HFYNPVDNQPLTVGGVPLGHTSPDWALEDRDTYLFQSDSFRSAHQAFLDALTLQASSERDKAFGHTFQALGQVIHHLQDMAQPQHTRNDAHLDLFGEFIDIRLVESPSLYERYTRDQGTALPFSPPYDRVTFTRARDFWHTDDGKGIADYSNRGFVSA